MNARSPILARVRQPRWTIPAFFFAIAGLGPAHAAPAPESQAPLEAHCRGPDYRQLDFWIGDWDVYDTGNDAIKVARVRVSPILDGCVLLEEYSGADGHQGRSFSLYDAASKSWRQAWVTNRGEMLALEGGLVPSGEIVLSGADRAPDGHARRVRGRWIRESGDVREVALRSLDDGASWTPWFDIEFRPHR